MNEVYLKGHINQNKQFWIFTVCLPSFRKFGHDRNSFVYDMWVYNGDHVDVVRPSLNCGFQQACCSSPDIWAWSIMVEWYGEGELLFCLPELSGKITSSHLVAKQEELAKEMMNLALQRIFVHTVKGSLTCPKILWHVADSFTFHPKGSVLWIFIALGWVWTHEPWVQWQAY
jgi:hypothetical protein